MKPLLVALVFLTISGQFFIFGNQWVDDWQLRWNPVKADSIAISQNEFDLGAVRPGSKFPIVVELSNQLGRELVIGKPTAECSCMTSSVNELRLMPGRRVPLQFQFKAPSEPGAFSKRIKLQPLESSDVEWAITVRGEAKAAVWCSPGDLTVNLDETGAGMELGIFHIQPGVEVGPITVSAPEAMTLRLSPRTETSQAFELAVNIKSNTAGVGHIDFHGPLGKELLASIPVQWRPPLLFDVMPDVLIVKSGVKQQHLRLTVVVAEKLAQSQLRVRPSVNWIQSHEVETVNPRVRIVRLSLDPDLAPKVFRGDVLEVGLEGRAERATVGAVIAPS